MPGLAQCLKNHDKGFLHIVADAWGIDTASILEKDLLAHITQSILARLSNPDFLADFSQEARQALNDLLQNQGAIPWTQFTRNHGQVREMGVARRDREKPYSSPISPAEVLWYRGILFREFQDTHQGLNEFACLPQEVLSLIPPAIKPSEIPVGRPAIPDECRLQFIANDSILDHTCTLLAGLRMGYSRTQWEDMATEWLGFPPIPAEQPSFSPTVSMMIQWLHAAGLLDEKDIPQPEATRTFLEASRAEALTQLFTSWKSSIQFNELRMLSSLTFEGNWQNDPLIARVAILNLLSEIPEKTWWSISAFIDAIHQNNPDFQRRAGEYDSWYIRSASTNLSLRGFEHWTDIEGELIRFILCSPLHWLGILDLATSGETSPILAFRITPRGRLLLSNQPVSDLRDEKQPIYAYADGRLRIPILTPRAARYQISRFCRWEHKKAEEYQYLITPESLELATRQGLRISQLHILLQRYASSVPPVLTKAISRWETHGCEARLEQVTVLRVRDADLIMKLKKSKVARFLGDSLGPTSIIIKPGGWEKVQGFLAEQGYLSKS